MPEKTALEICQVGENREPVRWSPSRLRETPMLRFTTPFHCRAVCFKELSDLCPSHIRVAVIVKGVKFPLSAEHVVQVLHALPDRIEFVPLREDCPHDFD